MPISRNKELGFTKSHAFVIGIDDYPILKASLDNAVNDAEKIAMRLKVLQGFDNVLLLENANLIQLKKLLASLANEGLTTEELEEASNDVATILASLANEELTTEELKEASNNATTILASLANEGLTTKKLAEASNDVATILAFLAKGKLAEAKSHSSKDYAIYALKSPVKGGAESEGETKSFDWTNSKGETQTEEVVFVKEKTIPSALHEKIGTNDSIVFYYAGHGFPGEIKEGPAGYLAPSDAKSEFHKKSNGSLLPMNKVYTALSNLDCKHTLLILDCCFAGKFRFASATRSGFMPFVMPMYKRRYEKYKKEKAWQVLVSAGPDETAADNAKWKDIREHSPFAKTLMEALEGRADAHTFGNKTQGDGIITATELFLYVWNQVEEITHTEKPQHPGLFPMEQHRAGEFIFINPALDADKFRFAKDPDKNPYKGLVAYEPEDADLYFGRDKATKRLIQKLKLDTKTTSQQPSLLFISAPSGAGKSSLVKAGLYPTLQKKYGFDTLHIFRPAATDQLLGETISPKEETTKIIESGEEKTITITGLYKKEKWVGLAAFKDQLAATQGKQVVLIDQFEDFFTTLTPTEKTAFEKAIVSIIQAESKKSEPSIVFLFTMRSDVEWQLETEIEGTQTETFNQYWQKEHIFRLIPMDLEELRQALTGPAWWALHDFKEEENQKFEDNGEKLINRILEDVAYFPANLPWLSCVMHSFYEFAKNKDRNQQLIQTDYQEMGGVKGAISTNAEDLYKKLSKAEKKLIQKLMLRMVSPSEGGYVRRKLTYQTGVSIPQELVGLGDPKKIEVIIEEMVVRNLLTRSEDQQDRPIIEPAHDALINFWPRCLGWITEFGTENILLQHQLWDAVLERAKKTKAEKVVV